MTHANTHGCLRSLTSNPACIDVVVAQVVARRTALRGDRSERVPPKALTPDERTLLGYLDRTAVSYQAKQETQGRLATEQLVGVEIPRSGEDQLGGKLDTTQF